MNKSLRLGLALACAVLADAGVSQVTPEQEYAKFVERSRAVMPMTDFGEQISPRDGSVTIRATDIELRGTGPTIRITRTYNPNIPSQLHPTTSGNNFGYWELEIPRIRTITANQGGVGPGSPRGWQVEGLSDDVRNQRCSNFSAPSRINFPYDAARGWNPGEWWDGYYLVDDGGTSQPLMKRFDTTINPGYPLTTLSNWLVDCLPSTSSGEPGEAFHAVAPDGTQYWFDHLVYTLADTLEKPLWTKTPPRNAGTSGAPLTGGPVPQIIDQTDQLERRHAAMLVTRIQDRFGNWISYHYEAGRLTRIDASDGRQVRITTDPSSGRIGAITTGSGALARTWTYTSTGWSTEVDVLTVTRPDQSSWRYSLPVLSTAGLDASSDVGSCTLSSNDYDQYASGSITSPAGARLDLRFNRKRFARSYVYKECWGGPPGDPNRGSAVHPREWYAFALDRRTITGPGLPEMTWDYSYSAPASSWYQDCPSPTSCASTAWAEVRDPQGNRHRSIFSTRFDETENKLLREEWYDTSGALLRSTEHAYATVPSGATTPYPWPLAVGDTVRDRVNRLAQGRWAPERQTTITQDGTTFSRTVTAFDAWARATSVTRSGPGGSQEETTRYRDDTSRWVMGLIDRVVTQGVESLSQDYDDLGRLLSTRKFGVPQASYTWYDDGTVRTQSDGAGTAHAVTYANWYRGLPQSVTYPTGASQTAVVDERGWISSVTDEVGNTTGYDYDAMGRLSRITPPAGFTVTDLSFEPEAGEEFGLGPGHWRQTVEHGDARTVTYYDGLWRPVMSRTFDATNQDNTRKVTVKQYDHDGRVTYESYPARDVPAFSTTPGGIQQFYDGLGREIRKVASSELGPLTTYTSYLTGFRTQVANPRGKITTTSLWALDDPAKAQVSSIALPAGVNVVISRDGFGKPTSISRGGTSGGYTSSVTRRYVYDAGQRLCKTVEPEIGATVQDYDAAGNVSWKASGQTVTGATECDRQAVASADKIAFGYDALNRLTDVTYGDGSPGVHRSYTADGLLEQIASNGSVWTYQYNALRKLATETLVYAGRTYNLAWGYNGLGHLSLLTYPGDLTVSYDPNALGEASAVSGFASGVSYHPNGAVAGYTLTNGIVHSLSQNSRGLPLINRDGDVLQDQYSYDANGNITAITDLRAGIVAPDSSSSRDMAYDDLDRLIAANAPGTWGSASYAYDPVDNLRAATVGNRSSQFDFNAQNQLASVVTNGSAMAYGFDARGNLVTKGQQQFSFDLGNRLSWSSLGGSYAYDGHGRRLRIVGTDGHARIQLYSQAGQLLWAESDGASQPAETVRTCASPAVLVGEQCVTTTVYAASQALGCPDGGVLSGSTCTRVDTSTYGASIQSYSCNEGDTRSGSTCTHVTLTTYAAVVATYGCNGSDTLSDTTCTHTTVTPATPHFGCPNGYVLSDTTCTATSAPTVTYGCGSSEASIGASPYGIDGRACLQDTVQSSSSAAQQFCQSEGSTYGLQFIRILSQGGKNYTCVFAPMVNRICPAGFNPSAEQCVSIQAATVVSYSCGTVTVSSNQCVSSTTYAAIPRTYRCEAGDVQTDGICTHRAVSTYTGSPVYGCNGNDNLSNGVCTHTQSVSYGASIDWNCRGSDVRNGEVCTNTAYSAPNTSFSCDRIGGTLNGQQCVGALRKTAYVYLGGKQIAEVSAGAVQYAHTDALGSPVAHTNSSGGLINRSRYEPYGYVAQGTKPSAATSAIGFTGHVQDIETDLVYMQQRYYDPIAGRFLSVDPVVTDANTGKGFGLYTYVDNNPYAKVDPDGREPEMKTWADPKGMTHDEARAGARMAGEAALSMVPGASSAEYAGKGQLGMAAAMLVVDFGPGKLLKAADKVGEAVKDFDGARRVAFEKAGMTDASKVQFSKVDAKTGTVVEFKGEGGAKVGYDGPHQSPGPNHDTQHISWQSAGKRDAGGAQRGNEPYSGPQHPSRPDRKEQ